MSLSKDVYQSTQHKLVATAGSLLGLPIDEFLADIDRAETVGPIVDPTLWMQGAGNLEEIKRLAIAAQQLQRVACDILAAKLGLPAGSVR